MSNVINFPNSSKRVALYTENHIYIGTLDKKESIIDSLAIWLINAQVIPIKARAFPDEILELDYVCVLWDKVVAFGDPPTLSQIEPDV